MFAPPEFERVRHARGVEEMSAAIAHNFDSLDQQKHDPERDHPGKHGGDVRS
jgi:hypothetical protein